MCSQRGQPLLQLDLAESARVDRGRSEFDIRTQVKMSSARFLFEAEQPAA